MLKIIAMFAVSVWATSTMFMLFFWLNAVIATYRQNGKIFVIPIGKFLYIHFCPIVHTVQCFKIMRRTVELSAQKRKV